MEKIEKFITRLVEPPGPEKLPRVRIKLADHGGDGTVLDGAVLEAAFQMDDGRFLIFLTDDVPFEETLRVILLDSDLKILDGFIFGGAYVTGTLENLQIIDGITVQFSFVHEKPLCIKINKKPVWLGLGIITPGVSRMGPWKIKRYLSFSFVDI